MDNTTPPSGTADLIPAFREDLCLDFANSRYWRGSEPPTEELHRFADVAGWCVRNRVLPAETASRLEHWAAGDPAAAGAAFDAALALREAIYRIFYALAEHAAPAADDLALLNQAIETAPARAGVVRTDDGFGWRLARPAEPGAYSLLAPVIWAAGDLLVGPRLVRVRHCANDRCLYLFIDDSKSGTRRWCSMASCGNRAKAHRHYVRRKAQ